MRYSGSLLLLAALSSPLTGEELPLALVPADALIVVQVRGLGRVGEKLGRLTRETSQQGESSLPDLAEALIRSLGFGVRLEGISATGPAFLVLRTVPDLTNLSMPRAFIVRIDDFDRLRESLLNSDARFTAKREPAGYETLEASDLKLHLGRRGEFAVLSSDLRVVEDLVAAKPGLSSKLTGASALAFLAADVSLYVDVLAARTTHAAKLQSLLELGSRLSQENGRAEAGAKREGHGLARLLETRRSMVAGLELRDGGLFVTAELAYEPGKAPSGRRDVAVLDQMSSLPAPLHPTRATRSSTGWPSTTSPSPATSRTPRGSER
jgi:hypothetical protein